MRVFVSYSRQDSELIGPLVGLMRTIGADTFRDLDSIPPGKRWRPAIAESIAASDLFLIFWCRHSEVSPEVRSECNQALAANITIVPALLDSTALSEDLAEFQALDLRPLLRSSESVSGLVHYSRKGREHPRLLVEFHRTQLDGDRFKFIAGALLQRLALCAGAR